MITLKFITSHEETKPVSQDISSYLKSSAPAQAVLSDILGKELVSSEKEIRVVLRHISDELKNGYKDYAYSIRVYGTCTIHNKQITLIINPFDSFDFSLRRILETLAHELVHYRQISEGRLGFDSSGFRWKNKYYTKTDNDTPWEVEANTRMKMVDRLDDIPSIKYPKSGKIGKWWHNIKVAMVTANYYIF